MASQTLIDKSSWGDGPWQHEPDRVEWKAHGFHCLITRNDFMVHLCGYVAVPPGHPWHGKQPNADAHGGVNYAESCAGKVCHVPAPGESDDVWWVGFDCGHGGDISPGTAWALKSHGMDYFSRGWSYRDLPYVTAEVEGLALQASKAQP